MKKIVIFKNDRIGDLFTSIECINKIFNKHKTDKIYIYLSNLNYKFSFLFKDTINFKISSRLTILNKIQILFFFIFNKIEYVYILKPRNFFYILPLIFHRTKFYGLTIKSRNKQRPINFLKKFLHKSIEIDRSSVKKRRSTYDIQKDLIEYNGEEQNLLNTEYSTSDNFIFPVKYIYFHYKHNLFDKHLEWNLNTSIRFIEYLSSKFENFVFSSDFNNNYLNNFFENKYTTFDYSSKKRIDKKVKKIIFLRDIDGKDLLNTIKNSTKVIAPEGMASHIAYFLKKEQLALQHFSFYKKQDFNDQIISCKEWFPPKNFNFIVLKKNFDKSLLKLEKRL